MYRFSQPFVRIFYEVCWNIFNKEKGESQWDQRPNANWSQFQLKQQVNFNWLHHRSLMLTTKSVKQLQWTIPELNKTGFLFLQSKLWGKTHTFEHLHLNAVWYFSSLMPPFLSSTTEWPRHKMSLLFVCWCKDYQYCLY